MRRVAGVEYVCVWRVVEKMLSPRADERGDYPMNSVAVTAACAGYPVLGGKFGSGSCVVRFGSEQEKSYVMTRPRIAPAWPAIVRRDEPVPDNGGVASSM